MLAMQDYFWQIDMQPICTSMLAKKLLLQKGGCYTGGGESSKLSLQCSKCYKAFSYAICVTRGFVLLTNGSGNGAQEAGGGDTVWLMVGDGEGDLR
jgi:hypothetical protein